MVPFVKTEKGLTVFIAGKVFDVTTSHMHYKEILEGIKQNMPEAELVLLIDVRAAISNYTEGSIEIKDDVLYYKGVEVHNVLVDKIFAMREQRLPITGMLNFLNNLLENPSYHAQQELYLYLEAGSLPITEDGHFLSYKSVRDDYKDIHSGKFDNSVGQVVEMPRGAVDDNRERTCSAGLHAAQFSYAKSFGYGSSRIMVLKINPKDVVSIPNDYENTKMRVCRYEVIAELDKADADNRVKNFAKLAVYLENFDERYYSNCEEETEHTDGQCDECGTFN